MADQHPVAATGGEVGIIGAGIAGLTLAAALHRAGIDYRVFEQAPEFGEVGAGIQLAPNATRLLRRLGLTAFLDEVGVRVEAIEMRTHDTGEIMARTPLGRAAEVDFGAPYLTVHRADLHRGLTTLIDPGRVRLGTPCTTIVEEPASVALRFADGTAAAMPVVAGADGIRSTVRAARHGDLARYSGQCIYRGLVDADRVADLFDEPAVRLWLGPGRHAVCYPVAGGRQISFGATTPVREQPPESWSEPGSVADLRQAYAGWHPRLLAVFEAATTVRRWALHDRDPMGQWSTARTTLVGDAAHPMLPFAAQGANQSIEDAVVLARLLATSAPAPALARYEQLRHDRTARVQAISRRNSGTLHDGTRPDPAQQRQEQQWLFGYDADGV